jgi:hypothetical protein
MISFSKTNMVRFALLTAFAISPTAVSALSFGVGPIGGMNFGNADVDDQDETEMRNGLALGLRAEFGVTSPYSLLVEPAYVQKGARFEYAGIDSEGDFDYIEIPLLLKAKFGAMKTHAFAFAGPSIGILTSTDGKLGSLDVDFEDQAASVVFSGDVGGGAAFQVSEFVYLSADVRYSHGFSNALEDPVATIDEWMSRDIRATLGLLFHLTQ